MTSMTLLVVAALTGCKDKGGDSGAPDPVDPARTSHGPVAADIAGPMGTPWPTVTAEQRATFCLLYTSPSPRD